MCDTRESSLSAYARSPRRFVMMASISMAARINRSSDSRHEHVKDNRAGETDVIDQDRG
jgi:hypothetical protein